MHYTQADRVLMEACWREDALPMLRERLRQRGIVGGVQGAAAEPRLPQSRIDAFFRLAARD